MANEDDLASALDSQSLDTGITDFSSKIENGLTSVGSELAGATDNLLGSSGVAGDTTSNSNAANRSTGATNNSTGSTTLIGNLAGDAAKIGTAFIAADTAKSLAKSNPGSTTTLFIVIGVVAVVGLVLLLKKR